MRFILLVHLIFCFLFSSCQGKKINFDAATKLPQVPFPAGQDKKWVAIRDLAAYKDDVVCDTLYSIYLSIDTSLRGHGEYYDVIFNTLVTINTEKSARTVEKIYSIKQPDFIFQSTLINLTNLTHYDKLFPGILNSLKPKLMDAHWVLKILEKGIAEKKITNEQLISWLPQLGSFYQYTKQQRNIPVPREGLILNIYYWISNPILARCLGPIRDNEAAKNILFELFNDSKNAISKDEKRLSWEAFKALDTLITDESYLTVLCKDVIFRKEVYSYLRSVNRRHLFPRTLNNQQSLSEMMAVSGRNLRVHDTDWPDEITYIGTKEVNNQHYYFYWLCWWKDCKSNSVVIVGPQPGDKNIFDDNPKLKGVSVSENARKEELNVIISNYAIE
ncbi:MAG TPA: hypothetical protein VIZ28_07700 [Chitinophagaceae bacterium]